MKFIGVILFAIIFGGGFVIFLSIINEFIDQVGAIYYWQSVGVGLGVSLMIYTLRLFKGYMLNGLAVYMLPPMVWFGVVGIPSLGVVMGLEGVELASKLPYFGTLISIAAFIFLMACGFLGTKETRLNE